ncbi:MAG: histidine phosphatase family protein [Oceanicaulis sp.]|uniref:SixA phosphatase family protein n=1 Tax=Glycocaulis sp. TaxID=1969725 RepID=UPI0025BAE688|nr:histidine phosphatase family protein [Glycocaulis sp.]MCC5981193.1 histidine phosphatase family protein [Oceanicaulis sp.]MCH8520409.1 histidine phosphatase family protein [Glycocaulis sp.]
MPSLIIMRHAKAVDRMEAEDDFDRGLTPRGLSDAKRAAEAMAGAGLKADTALVSPSRRTLETWKAVAHLFPNAAMEDPMALYHASQEMLERAVTEALQAGAKDIVLVGHNPGIGAFAHALAARADAMEGVPYGWPTSAVIAFDLKDADLNSPSRILLFNPKADRE